ncbi:hypothetical protein SRHO_G00290360, partial [Serrasalmus rhombeus]
MSRELDKLSSVLLYCEEKLRLFFLLLGKNARTLSPRWRATPRLHVPEYGASDVSCVSTQAAALRERERQTPD